MSSLLFCAEERLPVQCGMKWPKLGLANVMYTRFIPVLEKFESVEFNVGKSKPLKVLDFRP